MTEAKNPPISLLGTKTQPMTHPQFLKFLSCYMGSMADPNNVPVTEEDLKDVGILPKIMFNRLLNAKHPQIGKPLFLWLCLLSEDVPGNAVLWAYTYHRMSCKLDRVPTVGDWVQEFPLGVPTQEEICRVWDAQKGSKGENMLDQSPAWEVCVMNSQQFCDAIVKADGFLERMKPVYDQMQASSKKGLTKAIELMPYKKYWPAEGIEYIECLSPTPTTEPLQSIAPAQVLVIVEWEVRWTNPSNYQNPDPSDMEWKRVIPENQHTQTLDQRLAELLSFKYNGNPVYEVRALYTAQPEQPEPNRTLLEQYDLDQSIDYLKGYKDGRLKGYEVGQRHATEIGGRISPDCDVRKLVINVIPGEDGMGKEVYAKSIGDVQNLLTSLDEQIESLLSRLTEFQDDEEAMPPESLMGDVQASIKKWLDNGGVNIPCEGCVNEVCAESGICAAVAAVVEKHGGVRAA